jgi:GT2 family glycosyltransferase
MSGTTKQPLLLIIPFYRGLDLAQKQHRHLVALADELHRSATDVVLVNDFPGDEELAAELQAIVGDLEAKGVAARYVANDVNLGFVGSANRGLLEALNAKQDALLLNSDCYPEPGCIETLIRIAGEEETTGFVIPRSNRATLATVPFWGNQVDLDPEEVHYYFDFARRYLPEQQTVPTAPGSCMLIRWSVLATVGVFDEIYAPGYNEENDLVMRANRVGFRAIMANRAFAWHDESVSFGDTKARLEAEHGKILRSRYPEYQQVIAEDERGHDRRFERMIMEVARAKRERPTLLIDMSILDRHHNGTFLLASHLCRALIEQLGSGMEITVLGDRGILDFHGLKETIQNVNVYKSASWISQPFTFSFRPAQPFTLHAVSTYSDDAVFNIFLMLDIIAYDCLYLEVENPELAPALKLMADVASALIFISTSAQQTFEYRFQPDERQAHSVSLPSTKLSDYEAPPAVSPAGEQQPYLFVVGNHFDHKMVTSTTEFLRANFPRYRVKTLGYHGKPDEGVDSFAAGELSDDEMQGLYRDATAIIFPSNYEGFGFPTVESIRWGKHVIQRRRRVGMEIRDTYALAQSNLHFFDELDELNTLVAELERGGFSVSDFSLEEGHGWEQSVQAITDVMGALLGDLDRQIPLVDKRIRTMEWLAVAKQAGVNEARKTVASSRNEQAAQRELAAIKATKSWKMTAPLRTLRTLARRAG